MKIAFISGVKFGHELLSHILEKDWKVSIIFSYADSKKNIYSDYASFDDISKKYKIRNIKVQNMNDPENVDLLKQITPDLILVMGWSQILKSEIIKIPKKGVIGSHPTELPKYRGRAPIPWTIIKGLKESALTFFYIEEGVDDGDILDQRMFKISYNDDATTIYEKIIKIGKKMLLENLKLLDKGAPKRKKQDNSKFIEYWPKRTPEDGKIDWSKNGKEIYSLIRATTYPYPGAYTFFKNSKLKIWKASYLNEKSDGIGKIIRVDKEGVKVGTGKGIILLKKISIGENGKEVMASKVFSRDDLNIVLG
jgi:methionyl-tRNA formyltransferase